MSKLHSKEWQSQQIKQWGPAYVSPSEIYGSLKELEKAATVLGRDDLASELRGRVTPRLCEKYAPLLKVLRSLSREPLTKSLYGFDDTIATRESNPQDVWREAMVGIEDIQNYSYSEEDYMDESEEHEEEGEEEGKKPFDTKKPELDRSNNDVVDFNMNAPGIDQLEVSRTNALYNIRDSIPTMTLNRYLSHSEMIRELRLLLLQLPHAEHATLNGVSDQCGESIIHQFERFSNDLWRIEEPDRSAALALIRDFSCSTITKFVLFVETTIYKYTIGRERRLDASAVASLLSGKTQLGDQRLMDSVAFMNQHVAHFSSIPLELQHRNLVQAHLFACIARYSYGANVPDLSLGVVSQQEYRRIVDRLYIQNSRILMESGLRQTIIDVWNEISSVFLAQDPRILIFIDSWLTFCHDTSNPSPRDAKILLESVWPDNKILFNRELMPRLCLELPTSVQQMYGPNLNELFSSDKLDQCWLRILEAFRSQNPIIELEMTATTRDIVAKIERNRIPDPRVLIF